jgi:hypothetical protein
MMELIYQKWYFRRPELADRITSLLMEGPGDSVARVGERRIGKTPHLLYELIPAAEKRGFLAKRGTECHVVSLFVSNCKRVKGRKTLFCPSPS